MSTTWSEFYKLAFQEVFKNLKLVNGIAVGLNTNVDAIYHMRSERIVELIHKLDIDSVSLYKKIVKWKGIIEEPDDYVAGLCGCFEKGKASEWLIQNEDTYNFLLENLPIDRTLRMGGQAGIMANALSELGLRKVIVHSNTLPNELKKLFTRNKNLVMPVFNKNREVVFTHPRKVKTIDDRLYLHLISEIHKNDGIKIGASIEWICPKNNRFIATFDPPNAELKILDSFREGIELIATSTDAIILSGFHLLNTTELGLEKVKERIMAVLKLTKQAKISNPNILLHLELSSTKNNVILLELFKLLRKDVYWDSIGCNERELAEVLSVIGESKLAKEISREPFQKKVLDGCSKVCQKLSLKRLHLHQFGCYTVLTKDDYSIPNELVKKSLCFASLITAQKANTGKIKRDLDVDSLISSTRIDSHLTKAYKELVTILKEEPDINEDEFRTLGIAKYHGFNLISVPTILVDKPKFTVGLGDTISSTTLAAEIALKKLQSNN